MPVEQITVKPIIRELVRTRVCFPDLRLLVDRISIVKSSRNGEAADLEAYCLYLTDREKTIQAVIKSRLHKKILHGEIKEGSFVVLKDYQLARGKRINAVGEVIYLKIADFYAIGLEERNDREIAILGSSRRPLLDPKARQESVFQDPLLEDSANSHAPVSNFSGQESTNARNEGSSIEPLATSSEELPGDLLGRNVALSQPSPSQKRKRDAALNELDSDRLQRRRKTQSSGSDQESEAAPALKNGLLGVGNVRSDLERDDGTHLETVPPDFDPKDNQDKNENVTHTAGQDLYTENEPSSTSLYIPTNILAPIPRALKISTLASVTGANRTKNEVRDFLGLIVHVDTHTFKPPRMPRKRDLRIMDTSTSKQVVLSVFTDPVNFNPKVGTIAVFRNMTTHDWDGGNLKAYPWLCEGKAWFVPVNDGEMVEDVGPENIDSLRKLRDSSIRIT